MYHTRFFLFAAFVMALAYKCQAQPNLSIANNNQVRTFAEKDTIFIEGMHLSDRPQIYLYCDSRKGYVIKNKNILEYFKGKFIGNHPIPTLENRNNNNIFIDINSKVKAFSILNSQFNRILVYPDLNSKLLIRDCNAHSVLIDYSANNEYPFYLTLYKDTLKCLQLGTAIILNSSTIYDCAIDTFIFRLSSFKSTFKVFSGQLPKAIVLQDINFGDYGLLDFTGFSNSKNTECIFAPLNTDLSRVKLNYANFHLAFNWNIKLSDAEKTNIYKQLKDEQLRDGFKEGYKKIGIELAEYQFDKEKSLGNSLLKFLNKYWWNYGYDTNYLYKNSLYIFLLFVFINMFFYEQLITQGYPIKEFILTNTTIRTKYCSKPISKYLFEFFYCFLFTANIFWGIKLDIDKIKLKNIPIVSLIIIEYVVGILFILSIAHYALVN